MKYVKVSLLLFSCIAVANRVEDMQLEAVNNSEQKRVFSDLTLPEMFEFLKRRDHPELYPEYSHKKHTKTNTCFLKLFLTICGNDN